MASSSSAQIWRVWLRSELGQSHSWGHQWRKRARDTGQKLQSAFDPVEQEGGDKDEVGFDESNSDGGNEDASDGGSRWAVWYLWGLSFLYVRYHPFSLLAWLITPSFHKCLFPWKYMGEGVLIIQRIKNVFINGRHIGWGEHQEEFIENERKSESGQRPPEGHSIYRFSLILDLMIVIDHTVRRSTPPTSHIPTVNSQI